MTDKPGMFLFVLFLNPSTAASGEGRSLGPQSLGTNLKRRAQKGVPGELSIPRRPSRSSNFNEILLLLRAPRGSKDRKSMPLARVHFLLPVVFR